MIGSGIFLLPTVLAPFGLMSFAGWGLTSLGSILIALVIARLPSRTKKSGGVYRYSKDAFGDFTGFLIAWGYWASYWIAIPAISIAFVGYLGVLMPIIDKSPPLQVVAALALIWGSTFINMRGLKEAAFAQLLMTLLKLVPLIAIIGLGAWSFQPASFDNLPKSDMGFIEALATTALLTMWAFSGLEAGTTPAGDVKDPSRTVPRAIIFGTVTVAVIYVASTAAVMALVPVDTLINSTAPFAEAAKGLGAWGPMLVAIGALISTAGAVNGTIFISGQMPMAVALDDLAPKAFAKRGSGGTAHVSLLVSSILGSILLLTNYSKGLIVFFTFMITMSTLSILVPILVAAMAEIKYSIGRSIGWVIVAVLIAAYLVFAITGSGLEVILWGLVLYATGIPLYFISKKRST